MAFMNKIGNLLKQTSSKLPNFESSTSSASIFQAVRCFSSKLFVGGLSYATDENSLRETFTPYGNVIEARIIVDRESGRSRGFGFISYESAEEASAAIQALDGRDLHGRFIKVAYAAEQRGTSRGSHFSGGAIGNHTGGFGPGVGGSNYGPGGGFDNYGSTGGGSSGGYVSSSYGSTNVSGYNGVVGQGNGGTGYNVQSNEYASGNGVNVGPGGDYGRPGFSNSPAGGSYGYNAGDRFGGNAPDGGNYRGGGGYSNGNAGSYPHDGPNSFNSTTSYDSVGQDYGGLQGRNLDSASNFSAQDVAAGNSNDNGVWNDDTHRYANARNS